MTETDTDLPLLIDSRDACLKLFGDASRKNFYRLYQMIDRDEIGAKRLGDRWFIPRREMQKYIDENT